MTVALDGSDRSVGPVMVALSRLRAQLVVASLAFVTLSCVGTLHDTYRTMILDRQHGPGGFIVAVVSIMVLSLAIWFSSIIMMPRTQLPEWRRSGSASTPVSTAFVVAGISILPLMGLALGLWLAIPGTPGRDARPFSVEERPIPDQPAPQKRTELPLVSRG